MNMSKDEYDFSQERTEGGHFALTMEIGGETSQKWKEFCSKKIKCSVS